MFKKGDIVKCVDSLMTNKLTLGKFYTIEHVFDKSNIIIQDDFGCISKFNVGRFILESSINPLLFIPEVGQIYKYKLATHEQERFVIKIISVNMLNQTTETELLEKGYFWGKCFVGQIITYSFINLETVYTLENSTTKPITTSKCLCDNKTLFHHGCKCGYVKPFKTGWAS